MKAGYKEALAVGTRWGNPPACSPGAAPPGNGMSVEASLEALLRGYMPGENRPGSSPENSPCPYLNRLEALLRCCISGRVRGAALTLPARWVGKRACRRRHDQARPVVSERSDTTGCVAAEQRLRCGFGGL